jgi:hypothetical protein
MKGGLPGGAVGRVDIVVESLQLVHTTDPSAVATVPRECEARLRVLL